MCRYKVGLDRNSCSIISPSHNMAYKSNYIFRWDFYVRIYSEFCSTCRPEICAVGRKHFAVNKIFISQSRGVSKFLIEGLDFYEAFTLICVPMRDGH